MSSRPVRRSDGSYSIRYELPRRPDGSRDQRMETVKGTMKEAQALLAQRKVEIQNGTFIGASKQTVAEFLEQWLADYAEKRLSPTTVRGYQNYLRRYVIPALGSVQLTRLSSLQIERFYTQLLESGRIKGEGGISEQSVQHVHTILRGALNRAIKWNMLARNPCDNVDPPKLPHRESPCLTEEEVVTLLEAVRGTKLAAPVYLALGCGLRRGEVLGLTWNDIDLKQGRLAIRRAVMAVSGHLEVKEYPKTAASVRTLPIPEFVLSTLHWQKGEQAKRRQEQGARYQDQGIVVAGKRGDWTYPDTITSWFAEVAESLGLNATFHTLRHTHATLLRQYGVDIKIISERLGHSDVGTTLRVYTHTRDEEHRAAADQLHERLTRAIEGE